MSSIRLKIDVSVYYNDYKSDVGFRVAGPPLEGITSLEGEGFIAAHETDDSWIAILCSMRKAGNRMAQFNIGARVHGSMPAYYLLELKKCLEQFDESNAGTHIVSLNDFRGDFPKADRNLLAGIIECTLTGNIGIIDQRRALSNEEDIVSALSLLANIQLGRVSIGLPLPHGAEPCDISLLPNEPDFRMKETVRTTFLIDKDLLLSGTAGDADAGRLLSLPQEIIDIAVNTNNLRCYEIYDSLINRHETKKVAGDAQVLYTVIFALRRGGLGKKLLYKMYRNYVSQTEKTGDHSQAGRKNIDEKTRDEKKERGFFSRIGRFFD